MGDCYGSKFWNQGYGTEALKAFIDYMLNKVQVDIEIESLMIQYKNKKQVI